MDLLIQIQGLDPNFDWVEMMFTPEGFADMKDSYFFLSYPDTIGLPTGSVAGWTNGIPMLMVGFNGKILRNHTGNNQYIKTNSITLGGGESRDMIIDGTGVLTGTYFLYTPQFDDLSNYAENFGGLMTEIIVTP